MIHGTWRVCGRLAYRGHDPGDVFDATLDPQQAGRAIRRGAIELLDKHEPELPAEYALPRGWND